MWRRCGGTAAPGGKLQCARGGVWQGRSGIAGARRLRGCAAAQAGGSPALAAGWSREKVDNGNATGCEGRRRLEGQVAVSAVVSRWMPYPCEAAIPLPFPCETGQTSPGNREAAFCDPGAPAKPLRRVRIGLEEYIRCRYDLTPQALPARRRRWRAAAAWFSRTAVPHLGLWRGIGTRRFGWCTVSEGTSCGRTASARLRRRADGRLNDACGGGWQGEDG